MATCWGRATITSELIVASMGDTATGDQVLVTLRKLFS